MSDRRTFLTAVTGLISASAVAAQRSTAPPAGRTAAWDLAWLDQFKGTHKHVFDLHTFDLSEDTPLRMPTNYLDAMRDVVHAEGADVNIAIGITRNAYPVNATDAIWQKYKLGERWKINDPKTGQPAVRNIFAEANRGGQSISALQARGAVFWQCNQALGGVVQQLSRATNQDPAAVRSELVAGLMPGVKLVPAHTLVVGLAQERHFTYEIV